MATANREGDPDKGATGTGGAVLGSAEIAAGYTRGTLAITLATWHDAFRFDDATLGR